MPDQPIEPGNESGEPFTPEPEEDEADDAPEQPTDALLSVEAELARLSADVLTKIQGSSQLSSTFIESVRASASRPQRSSIHYDSDVTIPSNGDGSFSIALNETLTVGLKLDGASGPAEVIDNWGVHYGGNVSSIVTFPNDAIFETFTVISSSQDPQRYSFLAELPSGYRLAQADDSGVAIVDSEGFPALFIDAPFAVDALGNNVDLKLLANDGRIVLEVDHQDGDYSYPIVADPVWYYYHGYGYAVNHAEYEYCKWPSRYRICFIAFSESRSALSLARRYFAGRTLHKGVGDAFRHCYWSAAMTILISHSKAKEFGDMHETTPGQPAIEKTMDQRNNGIGRSVGTRVRNLHGGVLYRAEVDCLNKADNGDLWIIDTNGRLRLGSR